MIDYNFSTLNDKEFENLSIDLISIDKDKINERLVESYINTDDYESDHREVDHNVR